MFKDRAIETIQAGFTGTGTYNLGGAATNSQALDAAFGSGVVLFYVVRTATWSKVELGYGTVTSGSPDTLTRNVLRSYNGSTWGTSAVSWVSGDHPLYVYSVPMGEALASMLKSNAATSRPGWLPKYGMWVDTDTPSATVWTWNFFDGTDDIVIGTFDSTTNTFSLTGGTIASTITMATAAKILLDDSVTAAGSSIPLAFDGDPDTGMVRTAANTLVLVAGGAGVITLVTTGITVAGTLLATGDLSTNGNIYADVDTDTNWAMTKSGGNPLLVYDSGDSAGYDRGANQFFWAIASSNKVTLTATVLTTTAVTINAGAIQLQSGASLTHATSGDTVVDTSGHLKLRAYANVAALPSAASFPGRIVHLIASTSPGAACSVVSDGSVWRSGLGSAVS